MAASFGLIYSQHRPLSAVPCHVRTHRCSGVAELLVPWSLVAAAARLGLYGRALTQPSFGGVAVGSEPGWLQGFAGL